MVLEILVKRDLYCTIKNQVPDEDGEREIVELWKESNNWESWDKHLDSLIELLQQE